MFLVYFLAYVLAQYDLTNGNSIGVTNEVVSDQKLVLAYVVNRHGERNPDDDELSLSNQKEKLESLIALDGLEGLTNMGKRRAYQVGKFIRKRYGSHGLNLISNLYRPEEIAIRSTDKERAKMTVLVAMAAMYPPEPVQQFDEGLGKVWQPVPYTTIPLSEDYLRYYSNCKRYKQLMAKAKLESLEQEFVPYKDVFLKAQLETGRNFTEDPLLFQALFDMFKSSVNLGLEIPEWALPLMPKLTEAARLAYRLYFRDEEMKKFGGGVMLNDFVETATDVALGKQVGKRLRVFSAHDFNLGALMDVTKTLIIQNIPEYGSVFALELYQSMSTGNYSVMPVYLNQAGGASPVKTYRFAACEDTDYCDLNTFKQSTKEYLLSEGDFYEQCGIKTEL